METLSLKRYYDFRGTWHIGWLVEIVFGGTHKFLELSLYISLPIKIPFHNNPFYSL